MDWLIIINPVNLKEHQLDRMRIQWNSVETDESDGIVEATTEISRTVRGGTIKGAGLID